jgi:hypothetical protein
MALFLDFGFGPVPKPHLEEVFAELADIYAGSTAKGAIMVRSKSSQRTEPDSSVRTLKIEADGDFLEGCHNAKDSPHGTLA